MKNQHGNTNEFLESKVDSASCSNEPLSGEGMRRRAEMLDHLQIQMARHHEGRRRRRGAWVVAVATAGLLVVAVSFAWMQWGQGRGAVESIASAGGAEPEDEWPAGSSGVVNVESMPFRLAENVCTNAPDVVDRLVYDNQELKQDRRRRIEEIDDAELIQLFAETGRSASVGIIGGQKAVVVSRQF